MATELARPRITVRQAYRLQMPDGEILRVHSGLGTLQWDQQTWHGLGGTLNANESVSSAEISAEVFEISLSAPAQTLEELRTETIASDLADAPFSAHIFIGLDTDEIFTPQREILLMTGRVDHAVINADTITLTIYTAMTDTANFVRYSSEWNDSHQRRINTNDMAMQFMSESATKEIAL